MVGRKPKPAALKLVDGNPGKREIQDSPDIKPEIPAHPAHWAQSPDRRAEMSKEEWDRITPHLLTAQLINPLFMGIIVMYCEAWGEYVFAEEMLRRPQDQGGGYLVKTPNNYEVQSPWVAIKNKAFEKLIKCETEMCFTQSSFSRLTGSATMPLFPEDDPMEALLQARNGRPSA